jgi:hypothetical protein
MEVERNWIKENNRTKEASHEAHDQQGTFTRGSFKKQH